MIMPTSFLIPLHTGIGNAVLLTAILNTIKKNYPAAAITLLTDPKKGVDPLFPNYRIIHEVDNEKYDVYFHTILGSKKKWAVQTKLKNPRCYIITQYYLHKPLRLRERLFNSLIGTHTVAIDSKEHESLQYLRLLEPFKCKTLDTTVSLEIPDVSFSRKLPKLYCVIQLGTAFNVPDSRNWPLPHWEAFVEALAKKITIVLVGSKNEEKLAETLENENVISLIGKTKLDELVGIIKNSAFFLGVDSGLGHISGALNHPTFILWGPTAFVKSHQVGSETHFIDLKRSCSPCRGPSQMGLLSGPESIKVCPYNMACMNDITPETVLQKLQALSWI